MKKLACAVLAVTVDSIKAVGLAVLSYLEVFFLLGSLFTVMAVLLGFILEGEFMMANSLLGTIWALVSALFWGWTIIGAFTMAVGDKLKSPACA